MTIIQSPEDFKPHDNCLIANGYEPVPISDPSLNLAGSGKAPFISGWQSDPITSDRIATMRAAHPDHPGTGLRTGRLVGNDIDIVNEAHAGQVAALAFKMLGVTPLGREGSKGIMLCYRNESPLDKITVAPTDNEKAGIARIEILGSGQQFVAYGIHSKTRKPYQWGEDQDGLGTADPLSVPLDQLPEVTPEKLRAFAAQAASLLTELGYGPAEVTGDDGKERTAPSISAGDPVDESALRDAISYLDANEERDEWRDNIAAIRAANIVGDDSLQIRRQIAHEYSRGELDRSGRYKKTLPSRYTSPEAVDQVFDTMTPKRGGITVGTLFDRARKAGWQGITVVRSSPDQIKEFLETAERLHREQIVKDCAKPRKKMTRSITTIMSLRDLDAQPDPTPLIEGLFNERENAAMFGEQKLGKTFVALDAALSLATGRPALRQLKVPRIRHALYFTAEGHNGFKKRIRAWAQEHDFNDFEKFMDTVPFHFVPVVPQAANFTKELTELFGRYAEQIRETPGLVVIDTKIKSMRGMNENDTGDNEIYLAMCENFISELDCTTLSIAHAGLDGDRMRGATSAEAGFDAIWQVEGDRKRGVLRLSAQQMKDDNVDAVYHLKLKTVIANGMQNGKTAVPVPISADEYEGKSEAMLSLEWDAELKLRDHVVSVLREHKITDFNKREVNTQRLAEWLLPRPRGDDNSDAVIAWPVAIKSLKKKITQARRKPGAATAGSKGARKAGPLFDICKELSKLGAPIIDGLPTPGEYYFALTDDAVLDREVAEGSAVPSYH